MISGQHEATAVVPELKGGEQARLAVVDRSILDCDCEVAIVGAGPYGLAVAAHLNAAGVRTLIFGETMEFWRRHMPQGMILRSPWRGNHISDPSGSFSLDRYAEEAGIPYSEQLALNDFIDYGEWMQHRAAPNLDSRKVTHIERAGSGFSLILSDGDCVKARRVVMATGLANQEFRPAQFAGLPRELVTHSSDHTKLDGFTGKRIAVIGRGQTACEFAVLLHEAGAEAEIISRGGIFWTGEHSRCGGVRKALLQYLRPASPIGPSPLNWLIQAPGLLHKLPLSLRNRISDMSLRPTASAWLQERAAGIRMTPGRRVKNIDRKDSYILLTLDNGETSAVEHILLATGYRMDITRQDTLGEGVMRDIARFDGYPELNQGFESSVPGLHFVGSAAIHSFGPVMRSVYGAGPAARALTRAVVNRQAVTR